MELFAAIGKAPDATAYPNVARFYSHIASFTAEQRAQWPAAFGAAAAPAAKAAVPAKAAAAPPKAPAKEEEEEDADLFGDDGDAAAAAAAAKAKAAAAEKVRQRAGGGRGGPALCRKVRPLAAGGGQEGEEGRAEQDGCHLRGEAHRGRPGHEGARGGDSVRGHGRPPVGRGVQGH